MSFTIGCDPEIFLVDKKGNPLSAVGLIEGTKKEPYKIDSGAYQVDGLATEFNTDPVDYLDFAKFNENIVLVMRQLHQRVRKSNPDAKFSLVPTMVFGKDFLDAQPDEAKELGCDPDYNAYTLEPNPRPDAEVDFRTASGHIHIGWGSDIPVENEDHLKICANFVKYLDVTVGMFMTIIDQDPRRRNLYGKAGAFRPKSYGVEYRTPSIVWVQNLWYRKAIHTLIHSAINMAKRGTSIQKATGYSEADIRAIIDTGSDILAKKILESIYAVGPAVREALAYHSMTLEGVEGKAAA